MKNKPIMMNKKMKMKLKPIKKERMILIISRRKMKIKRFKKENKEEKGRNQMMSNRMKVQEKMKNK